MRALIRIQAMFKGIYARRRYKIHKINNEEMSKYFKAEESKETLDGKNGTDIYTNVD